MFENTFSKKQGKTATQFFVQITVFLSLLTPAALTAQAGHLAMKEGVAHYEKKEWGKAEKAFNKAGEHPFSAYNAGTAAYQAEQYTDAVGYYEKALSNARTPSEKSNALYNLGNALLRSGETPKAVEAYQKSLRIAPNKKDAKTNLQIALNRLRKKQPPPPPPPPPKTPPPIAPPQEQYLDRARVPQKKEVPTGGMSPDEARRLLETYVVPDEQKNIKDYRELAPAVRSSRVKKDW